MLTKASLTPAALVLASASKRSQLTRIVSTSRSLIVYFEYFTELRSRDGDTVCHRIEGDHGASNG